MKLDKYNRRVLVVAANLLGGIRSYLLYNAAFLSKAGYAFTFLAPEGEAFEAFEKDAASWPGVDFWKVPLRNRRYSLWPSVTQALGSRRFSLIHSQGLRAGAEAGLANCLLRIPHVITLHDTRHENDFPGRFGAIKKHLAGRFSARAHPIIAVSNDCAQNHLDFFAAWRNMNCRIDVIRNGVDIERLKTGAALARKTALREEFGWGEKIRILGYFGRFMPEKGFLVLLDALRLLAHGGQADRIRLVATKDSHGYRGEYMREVAQDAALSQMVRFVETVPEIARLLTQIDALVMPSLREACPLLPMEAMALGIPVVGSDAIGLREVLQSTPSIVPPAGHTKALAAAIERVLDDSSKQQAAVFAADACKRFDNRYAAEKLRVVYEEIS
jgi:glycosyltransferase involved in cell wall biosynthesis